MIDGCTQLVGLIGSPIEHSVSPAMHNAAFAALGLNWCYVPLRVPPRRVQAAVRGIVALGFRGANVTSPHKEAVLPHLDSVCDAARAVGAANTLRVQGGRCVGDNTDISGFLLAMRDAHVEPAGLRAVVVGAGGAARAVVYALLTGGAGNVVVLDRTQERALRLTAELSHSIGRTVQVDVRILAEEALIESARTADLLVNATTVGMRPNPDQSIWPPSVPMPSRLTVFDLVYNPLETRLLYQARQSGARPIGGLEMLVWQGALAFQSWTGYFPTLHVMRRAAQGAIQATC